MHSLTHLERVPRRLVFPQFVGDCGEQAVVGDDGLQREQDERQQQKRSQRSSVALLTVVPVFLSMKQPVPYL